jgi:hypothetical protein
MSTQMISVTIIPVEPLHGERFEVEVPGEGMISDVLAAAAGKLDAHASMLQAALDGITLPSTTSLATWAIGGGSVIYVSLTEAGKSGQGLGSAVPAPAAADDMISAEELASAVVITNMPLADQPDTEKEIQESMSRFGHVSRVVVLFSDAGL